MTAEEFNELDEGRKDVMIFEADKIAEVRSSYTTFELFSIDRFYIEARSSVNNKFKRSISTYTLSNLPVIYGGYVLSKLV